MMTSSASHPANNEDEPTDLAEERQITEQAGAGGRQQGAGLKEDESGTQELDRTAEIIPMALDTPFTFESQPRESSGPEVKEEVKSPVKKIPQEEDEASKSDLGYLYTVSDSGTVALTLDR